MENNISQELIKRIKSDSVITTFIGIGAAAISVIFLVRFITSIIASNFTQNDIQLYASNCVEIGFVAAAILILSSILSSICKTGKPFTKANTNKFKLIAILLIISAPLAMAASVFAGFLDPTAVTSGFTFRFADIVIIVFGVIIGIISEIFYYGEKLEDEMDKIA